MVKFTNNFTTWWNSPTIAQHSTHNLNYTSTSPYNHNCTWWNPQTIAQHGEIHPNNTQTTPNLNYTSTIPYHNTTIAKHGEINNQLHYMVKYTKITQLYWKQTMWKISTATVRTSVLVFIVFLLFIWRSRLQADFTVQSTIISSVRLNIIYRIYSGFLFSFSPQSNPDTRDLWLCLG